MPHKMFVEAYQSAPLGYLISAREALCVLLAIRIRDSKLQSFVFKWALALLAIFCAGILGFNFVPVYVAVGIFAPSACLCAFLLWLSAGDMFLNFALEDELFYDLAVKSHALSVFQDTEFSVPQPID